MADRIGPSYRKVADDIRSRIASGELGTGTMIPSTTDLKKHYGQSETVVRRAVRELQDHQILVGHPGKGVFVKATPEQAAQGEVTLEALTGEVAQLRAKVAGLEKELAKLRKRMGQMEADLASAAEESHGGKREHATTAAGSGRR